MVVERFAPSPTGLLHLGHAFSAWTAWSAARHSRGRFLLRMEDLDRSRVRPEYYTAIETDLAWLGISWDGDVLAQSDRDLAYKTVLADLAARGLTYRCTCTRRDIAEALSAPQERIGPDGPVYPGTCRGRAIAADEHQAVRLNMGAAVEEMGRNATISDLGFHEIGDGVPDAVGFNALSAEALVNGIGDIVLSRRDGAVAYHLAVVVDDAHQGVTHVTRGADLFAATAIHRVLQGLLALPTPVYRHHRLIRDDTGKRLAKRDDARAIAAYRDQGLSADEVLALAGISDPHHFD